MAGHLYKWFCLLIIPIWDTDILRQKLRQKYYSFTTKIKNKNSTVPIIQTVLGIVVSLIDNKLCQYKSQVTFKNRTKWCKNKEATRIKLL